MQITISTLGTIRTGTVKKHINKIPEPVYKNLLKNCSFMEQLIDPDKNFLRKEYIINNAGKRRK